VGTNLIAGREPLYGLGEWAARYDPGLLGLGRARLERYERSYRAVAAELAAELAEQPRQQTRMRSPALVTYIDALNRPKRRSLRTGPRRHARQAVVQETADVALAK